jgi:hypothetical protein
VATGTATLDFGATPTDAASVLVSSGLSGLSVATHKEAFVQGDDATGDNDAAAHRELAAFGRFACEYVSATSMRIYCELVANLATGQFTLHWVTA